MSDSATLPVDPQAPQPTTPAIQSSDPNAGQTNVATVVPEPTQLSDETVTPTTTTADPQVEALVNETVQLQTEMQQADQVTAPSSDVVDNGAQANPDPISQQAPTPDPSADVVGDDSFQSPAPDPAPATDAEKSPLDILEDILAGSGTGEDGKPAEPTQTPEEVAAEIQAAREKVAQEEAVVIEEHRKKLLSELQTPEQQKRDEVRGEQAEQMKSDTQFDIPQLQRKKMVVGK